VLLDVGVTVNGARQSAEVVLDEIDKCFVEKDVGQIASCPTVARQNLEVAHQWVATQLGDGVEILLTAQLRG
jgi:hypothetical protein